MSKVTIDDLAGLPAAFAAGPPAFMLGDEATSLSDILVPLPGETGDPAYPNWGWVYVEGGGWKPARHNWVSYVDAHAGPGARRGR